MRVQKLNDRHLSNLSPRRGVYYGWYIVAAAFFITFLTISMRTGFGVFVKPMSDELDWSRAIISLAAAIGWLVNGVSQPFAGWIYDRIGGRKVVLTSLLLVGLCTILLSRTNNIGYMIVFYGFALSIALSGVSSVTLSALLSAWFSRKRGTALGLVGVGAPFGQLLLIPFTMYLLLLTDWRTAWVVLGGMVLVLAIPLAFIVLRDRPQSIGLLPDGDITSADGNRPIKNQYGVGPLEVEYWMEAFQSRPIWQLSAGFFVCGFTSGIIAIHFVPIALDRGFTPSTAANAFGILGGLNIISALIVGPLSDRLGRKNLLCLMYVLRGAAFALLVVSPATWTLFGFVALAGLSWVSTGPLTAALTVEMYGLKNMGTLTGLIFFSHQIGGSVAIFLGGWIYDLTGAYDLTFVMAVLLLGCASLASFTISEKKYSAKFQPLHPTVGVPSP